MDEIKSIVRGAISAGLIPTVSLQDYERALTVLDGNALEDYLQTLWDSV